MTKIYFNHVSGNRYEGYPVRYINEYGNEFNLIITPSDVSTNAVGNIHRHKLVNNVPCNIGINTVITPSATVQFAENMEFFDPMSVNYIQKTIPWKVGEGHANFAFAFPGKINVDNETYIACNHNLTDDTQTVSNRIFINNTWQNYGDPGQSIINSIIAEEYKKDVFNIGYSSNIFEISEQYNKSINEIFDTIDDPAKLLYVRYPISSNENVDPSKVSLSYCYYNQHVIPSGNQPYFAGSYWEDNYSGNAVFDPYYYGGIEDTWAFEWDGLYMGLVSVGGKYSDGLPPEYFLFIEDAYYAENADGETYFNLWRKIVNENSEKDDEYYYQLFYCDPQAFLSAIRELHTRRYRPGRF